MAEYEGKLHINNGTSYDDLKLDTNAEYVKYDNTISGLTATNTKTAIDELSDASGINYDNTTSGLTATKVQGAIDEVNNTLETFGCDLLFERTNSNTTATYSTNYPISNYDLILAVVGETGSAGYSYINGIQPTMLFTTGIAISCGTDGSSATYRHEVKYISDTQIQVLGSDLSNRFFKLYGIKLH